MTSEVYSFCIMFTHVRGICDLRRYFKWALAFCQFSQHAKCKTNCTTVYPGDYKVKKNITYIDESVT